jgi:hypothetical protein
MSRPHGCASTRYGESGVPVDAGATRAASSAESGTTQGEIEVWNDLPRNGPSGTVSHAWMSRADQSLTRTRPKT